MDGYTSGVQTLVKRMRLGRSKEPEHGKLSISPNYRPCGNRVE